MDKTLKTIILSGTIGFGLGTLVAKEYIESRTNMDLKKELPPFYDRGVGVSPYYQGIIYGPGGSFVIR